MLPLPATPENATAKVKKPKFGDALVEKVYREAHTLASEIGIFRIYQFEEIKNTKVMTLCNLWRYTLKANGNISVTEYCLDTQKWKSNIKPPPNITLLPFGGSAQNLLWSNHLHPAIEKLMNHVFLMAKRADPLAITPGTESKFKIAMEVFKRYVMGRYKDGRYHPKRLNHAKLIAAGNGVRACIWDHLIDRDVLKVCKRIDPFKLSLYDYLKYHRYREHAIRISNERPNLLPLLQCVKVEHWKDLSLFSKKYWIGEEPLARSFMRAGSKNILGVPLSSREWNWLNKASMVVVRKMLSFRHFENNIDMMLPYFAEASASINTKKIPVIAWLNLIQNFSSIYYVGGNWGGTKVSTKHKARVKTLIRTYLVECATIWEREGYKSLQRKLKYDPEYSLTTINDAFAHHEGVLPSNITWNTLSRLSRDWHRTVAHKILLQAKDRGERASWECKIPETVIDEVTFTPILNDLDLAIHGYEMDHCVGGEGYVDKCLKNRYQVFKVESSDGLKGTLGLSINKGKAVFEQFRGFHNHRLPPEFEAVAKKFITLYNVTKKSPQNLHGDVMQQAA